MKRSELSLRVGLVRRAVDAMDDSGKSLLHDRDGLQFRLFRNKVKQADYQPADITEGSVVVLTAMPDRNNRPWRVVEVHAVVTAEQLPEPLEHVPQQGERLTGYLLYSSRLEGRGLALVGNLDLVELDLSRTTEQDLQRMQIGSTVSFATVWLGDQYAGLQVALVPEEN